MINKPSDDKKAFYFTTSPFLILREQFRPKAGRKEPKALRAGGG